MNRSLLAISILVAGSPLAGAQPVDGRLGVEGPTKGPTESTTTARTNVARSALPLTHAGDYVLDPLKAPRSFGPDPFGAVTVEVGGRTAVVRDQHYVLARGKAGEPTQVGLRMIPVSDPHVPLRAGQDVDPQKPGSHLIDAFLRKTQGLGPQDPIFALVVYSSPPSPDKTAWRRRAQDTDAHVSVYLGQGYTRSSPEQYHRNQWFVKNRPATVQLVSLEGVDPATLNRNGQIAATILNQGVSYPDSAGQPDAALTLERTLQVYRGWLEDDPRIKGLHFSSAEHTAVITNVMLNVPHNAAAFRELWGEAGRRLLSAAKAKYRGATGQALVETSFEPLWKKDKLPRPTQQSWLDPALIGRAMAWAPQTPIDQLLSAVDYAAWPELGAPAATRVLLRITQDLINRLQRRGASTPQTDRILRRLGWLIARQMFIHEAMTTGSEVDAEYYAQRSYLRHYVDLGGKASDLVSPGKANPQRLAFAHSVQRLLMADRDYILGRVRARSTKAEVYALFQQAVAREAKQAQAAYSKTSAAAFQGPRYESSSAVTHHIASGRYSSHAKVSITSVATALDAEQLISKQELAKRQANDSKAAAAVLGGDELGLRGAMRKQVTQPD